MAKVKRSEIIRVLELAVQDTGGYDAHRQWVSFNGSPYRKDGLWELRELLAKMKLAASPPKEP